MRKVFTLFAGLVLLSMLNACSDTTPTPPRPHTQFAITTATVPAGCSCSPYNVTMAVQGGTAPYTWTLADGSDALPAGLVLTSAGKITGVITATGDFSFTVHVTDSSPTPKTVDKAFDMSVTAPSNPSLAVFFDGNATVCQSSTAQMTALKCYVYLMLDGSESNCSTACEFKVRLTDSDNVDLTAGSQYVIANEDFGSWLKLGSDLFSGVAIAFGNQPVFGPEPVQVATFDLWLIEDLQNLSFKFEPNPGGVLGMATCDQGQPVVNVIGRETAVNYGTE
ncbi:MAG TPA: Ig domain-containing protein [Candidatus Krumholzibacteriaceae bacterium]